MFSCEKYPENGYEILESVNFDVIGNNQTAEGGQYLDTEIGVQINLQSLIPSSDKKFHLELLVTAGGGRVDETVIEANSNGKMITKWKLGSDSNTQIIKAKILNAENRLYSEFTIHATAFFQNDWNTITTGYLTQIQDMAFDTLHRRSIMLSGRDLYDRGENFNNWEIINNGWRPILLNLEVNSKGHLYGTAANGNLYLSANWGQTWEFVNKPIPENNSSVHLTITPDDNIWIYKYELGMYCSIDGGLTWTKDSTGLTYIEELGRVYKFNENSHLVLESNDSISQTFDNGISWKTINTPKYPKNFFITDRNEIIVHSQGDNFTLEKSTDYGLSYRIILSVSYDRTWSWSTFQHFADKYYVIAPGGGIYQTKDFEEFEKLISVDKQHELFIDHTGTIYACGNIYANADPDPTLVLPGSN
jgi:hypothetical protein